MTNFVRGLNPKAAMGIGVKITQKEIMAYVKTQLATNKTWATQALLRIFDLQTEDEKMYETTNHNNKVGFTGADAELLSSFAKQYQNRGFLSPKQMAYVYKKMPKYWSQIAKLSNQQHLESLVKNNLSEK